MLLNSFFTYHLNVHEKGLIDANLSLNEKHRVYQGHFPGQPVTPGVCQVAMIKEVLMDVFRKKLVMKSAKDIKFVTMINPLENKELKLKIDYSEEQEFIKINARLLKDDMIFLKLRGELHEANK